MTKYNYEAFVKRYGKSEQTNIHDIFENNIQNLFRNAQMYCGSNEKGKIEIEILLND